jgi:hypothetical protein
MSAATLENDREYDSTASALEGRRELNAEVTDRLKQLWKKLVRMKGSAGVPHASVLVF